MKRTDQRPRLSHATIAPTVAVSVINEYGETLTNAIPGEHALTVYLNKRELVTLMTLGAAPEALVLGYLRNQRFVESLSDIAAVQVDWETGAAAVTTHDVVDRIEERTSRRVVTTGCGQGTIFGGLLDDIDSVALDAGPRFTQRALYAIVETIRTRDSIYKHAGSVHGCALFDPHEDGATLSMFFEDVGRHNAVDSIAGRMWLEGVDGRGKVFYTTGRLTSEMVIKGAQMGVAVLMSRSGVTQMGYDVAQRVGMTLFGRCTGRHFLLYSGHRRFVADVPMKRPAALAGAANITPVTKLAAAA